MRLKTLLPLQHRTLLVLLFLSLSINLLFGAVIAGRWVGEWVKARSSLQAVVSVLPKEKRELASQELSSMVPMLRQHGRAMRALLVELDVLLKEPQLDDGAVNQQFLKLQQQNVATQAQLQQAFKRAVANLTPQERRDLLLALIRLSKPEDLSSLN